MDRSGSELDLPGFRFHPTEEELLDFYLRRMVLGKKLDFNIIGTINLYRFEPWELPRLAKIGEREWYFFVPRDRRQSSGGRPNRTTEHGFWKATGSDRHIRSAADPKRLIGLKKTLVFYNGRAPRGTKTDWIMNEYRLPDTNSSIPPPKEDIVLCKIYRKATSLKELEQRAAQEEDARAALATGAAASIADSVSTSSDLDYNFQNSSDNNNLDLDVGDGSTELISKEEEVKKEVEISSMFPTTCLVARPVSLPELQVPRTGMEWQDPFLTQLRSPWLEQWSPLAHLLNF